MLNFARHNRGRHQYQRPIRTTHGIHADDAHSVGYQQFENVASFVEHSAEFSKRVGIGQVTKLSVLPRLELFLRSEPLEISQSGDQTAVHEGEVFAGVQSVLLGSAHFGTNEIRAEQVQGDIRRVQFAQTLSISHPLGKFTQRMLRGDKGGIKRD